MPAPEGSLVEEPRVAIIACASSKLPHATAARDLYVSTLFKESRKYAEARSSAWYILSALHGLVEPERILEPYNLTLNEMPVDARRIWAGSVGKRLLEVLPAHSHITLLAGAKYREFLEPFLRRNGFSVEVPLEGLGIGQQVQFLQRANSLQ